ncbi:APC family permease [Terriglobus roseus]|uniref:APC family permease n=1 Tax=Terriglobus roseus TaxID=392734 RepID=UPI0003061A9C|nr:APC family permease [Terriglobus roseus]
MKTLTSSHPATGPRKLRLLPLLAATYFMVSGGPYGLEDIIGFAGYGRALILLFLLPFVWSLPTALMIGELAASVPEEGGFYAWVRRAMGPFWGFQEAWLSLSASIFDMAIYPTIFVSYLSRVAPSLTSGHRGLLLEITVVILSALWNLRGAVAVGVGSVWLWLIALSPFLALVGFAVWTGAHGPHAAMGAPSRVDLPAAILVAMWNYMGWDNATTIASEVEDPQRSYPRVMLYAAGMVMATYLIPVAAVAWAGIPPERFSTGAWADAAHLLGGSALAVCVVLAGSLDSMGTFNALTLSYTRLPYAMACDGLLPRVLSKRNAANVPWVALVACATCWALALKLSFERLITVDVLLWGLSLILEFAALIILRRREPDLPRPFRVPGPTWVAVALGCGPVGLMLFALWAARDEHVGPVPASLFALAIAACGLPLYWLVRRFVPATEFNGHSDR